MSTNTTEHTETSAQDLVQVTDHVWTSTSPTDAGYTLIERPGASGGIWTLVDYGRDLARTAALLHSEWERGRTIKSVVLLAGWNSMSEAPAQVQLWDWIPQRVDVLDPYQCSAGGTTLPHIPQSRAYRVGPDQAVIWSPADAVMIAGGLMAPDLPDLSHISPRRAMEGLQYAVAHAPLVVIGTHANVVSARAQVANGARVETRHLATVADLRMRMDYLRDLVTVAQAGAVQGLTPRAAAHAGWDRGVLSRWSSQDPARQTRLNRRHLLNMHSAMAAELGVALDPAAAEADAAALTAS